MSGMVKEHDIFDEATNENSYDFSSTLWSAFQMAENRQLLAIAEEYLRLAIAREHVLERKRVRNNRQTHLSGRRLSELKHAFSLSRAEARVVAALYCAETSVVYRSIISTDRLSRCAVLIAISTGIPENEVIAALRGDGALLSNELVTTARRYGGDFSHEVHYKLTDATVEFLEYCTPERRESSIAAGSATLSLECFPEHARSIELILALLAQPAGVNILVYGPPGVGKTEFAHALAFAAGRNGVLVPSPAENPEDHKVTRRFSLRITVRAADPDSDLVIADDAEDLLQTDAASPDGKSVQSVKAHVNRFLEDHGKKLIWICNNVRAIDEAVLRRFTYSVEFHSPTPIKRLRVWDTVLARDAHSIEVSADLRARLAREYQVSAAGITNAVRSAAALATNHSEVQFASAVQEFLAQHERLVHGRAHVPERTLEIPFDPELLETDVPISRLLVAARSVSSRSSCGGATFLFSGPPGTGKSEAALYLAREAGVELLRKSGAELLSPWVGSTERLIAEAFLDAENSGALLLIDEAESFIYNREQNVRRWEASMINEFLQRMEQFRGTLICTTNLLPAVDAAAMRRFHWKVRFLPLPPHRRIDLLRLYFPDVEFDSGAEQKLRLLPELFPGDVQVVRRTTVEAESTAIIAALDREVRYRSRNHTVTGFR